jgi:hypothetical protein
MKCVMSKVDVNKFLKEYSALLIKNEELLTAGDNAVMSASTFYKSTNSYKSGLPKNKTFIPVMTAICESSNPLTWSSQITDPEILKFIEQKFTNSKNEEVYINDFFESCDIYEAYAAAASMAKNGIPQSRLLNGIAALKVLNGQPESEYIELLKKNTVDAYKGFSEKVVSNLVERELIGIENGSARFRKASVFVSSLNFADKVKRLELIKPYLHQYQSTVEASVSQFLSLNPQQIKDLRRDLHNIYQKYSSPEMESTGEHSEVIGLSLSIINMSFDEFIGEEENV